MAKITFNPTGTSTITLDAIPDQVKSDVEELYAATYWPQGDTSKDRLEKPVAGNFLVEEDSKEAVNQWFAYAKSYGAQRPDGTLILRRSPTKKANRSDAQMYVTIREPEDDAADQVNAENAQRSNSK